MPEENRSGSECCSRCLRFIITCGFAALFLWLALRTNSPTLSIEQFDVLPVNSTSNRTIFFDLKLKNRNKEKGVYYDLLNITISYSSSRSSPIANPTFPAFYQGHDHSARRTMTVSAGAGGNGFRVEVETKVRFKVVFWKTKRKRVEVGADLKVDEQGKLVRGKKGVKLTSSAQMAVGCYAALLLSAILHLLLVGPFI